ncbi:hypothetical protein BSKO_09964 [Bryopsis sp. KO-2023]|nr:hypothetical protein BSKO_09964 [Bryopsis sp. KO-2023]
MQANSVSTSAPQLTRQPCRTGLVKAPWFLMPRKRCGFEKQPSQTNHRLQAWSEVAFLADAAAEVSSFEPRFNPAVGVAALVAAIPPILFWVRVYNNIQRVEREKREEEEDRQNRIKRLFGKD